MTSSSYPYNSGQPRQQHHEPQHQQIDSSSSSSISPPTNVLASPVPSNKTNASVVDENHIVRDYRPPGVVSSPRHPGSPRSSRSSDNISISKKNVQWVYNPSDGSVLMDHNGIPVSVDRLLATKPLRHELSTRPGPGNKKLLYISGDDVSRTLNDIFGFDGWDLDIQDVTRIDASRDPKTGKHTIVYTARVRVTHKASGAYKEDCGAGDSTDRIFGTAIAHALKASITDAMKRAARHFGDKLGNSLYAGNFSLSKAPVSLKDALDKYDIHRCNTKFGFQQQSAGTNRASAPATTTHAMVAPQNHAPATASTSTSINRLPSASTCPPTTHFEPCRQKAQHEQQHRATSVLNTTATNINSGIDKVFPGQQYQTHQKSREQQQRHQHQKPRQQERSNNTNVHPSHIHRSSDHNQQIQQHHGTNSNPPNFLETSNNDSVTSSTNTIDHRPSGAQITSNSNDMPSSTNSRTTFSYGRRPPLGSNISMNTSLSGRNSVNNNSSGTYARTASMDRQQFNPNDNVNNNNNNRRVSLDQKNPQSQQQRQPMATHTPRSTSSNANAHMVSLTPSTHGGGSNHYSNQQQKRPPLGNVAQNPTVTGVGSEFSSKRQKQHRHHNPYNQPKNGRKSI